MSNTESQAIENAKAWAKTIEDMATMLNPKWWDGFKSFGDRPPQYHEKIIMIDEYEVYCQEDVQESVYNQPLSIEFRSGWVTSKKDMDPEEFMILLSTGGPALRIIGSIGNNGSPSNCAVEYRDWGTPWTEYFGVDPVLLQTYCECFYFGE